MTPQGERLAHLQAGQHQQFEQFCPSGVPPSRRREDFVQVR